MQMSVDASKDGDLERRAAHDTSLRLITVPMVGTQEPQEDFRGRWRLCSPETAGRFSAVGYFFGRQLRQTLGVPVGVIHDSWGGSACEAWIRRDLLASEGKYGPLLERWEKIEQDYPKDREQYQKVLAEWQAAAAKAKEKGEKPPTKPSNPEDRMRGNGRPGNLYNGMLRPVLGYGLRGVIWYQGETNVERANQYRHLFPLMIRNWRDEWGLGDFPFYWVQLADFLAEKAEPAESSWAELRESQTMTLDKLPNTGEAVIIDSGEGKDIHPLNKQDVAKRLARWALARDYGISIPYRSPRYKSMEVQGNKVILTFDHVGGGLKAFDVNEPRGFAVAASDRQFVGAQARIVGKQNNQVEVWSERVSDPVAVRYAWADNPVCNLYSQAGLPVTPFRTDDWPGVTVGKE
jgi:sialate O-acetylesterase